MFKKKKKPSHKESPVADGFFNGFCQAVKEEIIPSSQTLSENKNRNNTPPPPSCMKLV